ncbi:MAG: protein translocase subunit SecF, partial [Anaerolineae bacterium]|nr:protein translocase subunit SecF [Anaerolineae bacterium]
VIIPGLIAMIYSTLTYGTPLRLSIDFTGGSFWEIQVDHPVQPAEVRAIFVDRGFTGTMVQTVGDGRVVVIRLKAINNDTRIALRKALEQKFGHVEERQFRSVGPTIGKEVTEAATVAVVVAAIAIIGFIVFAFRQVPHPFRFGVCAIIAMIHDILVTTGLYSIAGLLWGWEADALFLTAVLTVIGFSVQDTIVVFDRIRENVPKHRGEPFETVVNRSLLETIHRSLATQLNAIFVMVSLLLFGGSTIRQFIAAMLVGLISGTYSSLFNAVPLLVVWEQRDIQRIFSRLLGRQPAAIQS